MHIYDAAGRDARRWSFDHLLEDPRMGRPPLDFEADGGENSRERVSHGTTCSGRDGFDDSMPEQLWILFS
jgi:hypothetical protein